MTISKAPTEQEATQDRRADLRVLAIEDNPLCRRMLLRQLESCGFAVRDAADGREGLRLAGVMRPDIILLDLNLPNLSGFEVMQRLREDPDTRDIPVLCVTGETDPASLLRDGAKGLGACGFLLKPFTRDQILMAIERGLAGRPGQEGPGDAAGRMLIRGPLRADRLERRVWIGDREIRLVGHRQFPLLWELMERDGPVTCERLLAVVWGEEAESLATVRMAIMRLRCALETAEAPCRIETTEHGYRLVAKGPPGL